MSDYKSYESPYSSYHLKVEGFMFNLANGVGGLVVYTSSALRGKSLKLDTTQKYTTVPNLPTANVVERVINGRPEFAAIFPAVAMGNWALLLPNGAKIELTIYQRQIAEIDLR